MRGFFIALTFLTRIPLPESKREVTPDEFARSMIYYPLVGLLMGLILWLAAKVFILCFPPLVAAALIMAAGIMLSGGIHLDGFMDSMDGLLSARSPESALEIMKDSRVGAHACISLVCLLILKFSLIYALIELQFTVILLIMPLISRWVFQIGVICFPYAREEGLGKNFKAQAGRAAFLLSGVLVSGASFLIADYAGVIAFGVCTVVITLLAWAFSAILGGLTGDLYGALIEIAEVVCLLAVMPFLYYFKGPYF